MLPFGHRAARCLCVALLLSLTERLAAEGLSSEQWRPVEIALAAAKPHPDPFYGVDVTADAIRFLGKKGSLKQPSIVRVVQLEVVAPAS